MSENDGHELGDTSLDASADRGDAAIGFDQLFSLLASARRRHALYCLAAATSSSTLTTAELADRLAVLEARATDDQHSRTEIELTLRHSHLPKLDDADVIDYDPEQSVVLYRGGRRADRWIDRAMEAELATTPD